MTDIFASPVDRNTLAPRLRALGGVDPLHSEPAILRPYHAAEAVTIEQAAGIAGRKPRTLREWALLHDLGRKIGGRWMISRVALAMFLDGNIDALDLYLRGDRRSGAVTGYYLRLEIPLPRNIVIGSKPQ